MKPNLWKRFALALGAVLFALAVGELAVRIVWTPPSIRTTPYGASHELYGWCPAPGRTGRICSSEYEHGFTHTAQAIRGATPFGPQLAAGAQKRVLFLGDSFTYGLGCGDDETFAALLAARSPELEIANLGCSAYGTREELAVLDHFGAAFRPELTVLVFFWNDLQDNFTRDTPAFSIDGDRLVRADGKDPAAIDAFALRPVEPWEPPSPWTTSYLETALETATKALKYRLFGKFKIFPATQQERDGSWRTTVELLRMAAFRARQIGTRLVVACVPDYDQVDPSMALANVTEFHYGVQDRMQAACTELGIGYHELLPGLRQLQGATSAPLYYYVDRHLTPLGHRAVAELLGPVMDAELANLPPLSR